MQRKLSNNMKLLKALGNGPKTQAELMRETKVKNTYQIVADLVKKGLVTKENGLVTRKSTYKNRIKSPSR
jgi:DNA-binding IclR family transcriptional regulator